MRGRSRICRSAEWPRVDTSALPVERESYYLVSFRFAPVHVCSVLPLLMFSLVNFRSIVHKVHIFYERKVGLVDPKL